MEDEVYYIRNYHTYYYDTLEKLWIIEAPDGKLTRASSEEEAIKIIDNAPYKRPKLNYIQ